MHNINRIIAVLISGILTYLFYHLDKRAIAKGHFWGRYGKTNTIWSLPFYFSAIILIICLCGLFGILD